MNTQQLYALIGQLTVENMALKAQIADFLNTPPVTAKPATPPNGRTLPKRPDADAAKPAS